MLLNSTLKNYL